MINKNLYLLLLAPLPLLGCAHAKETYLSNGSRGYSISCGGPMNSWTSCAVKAGRKCGRHGYTVTFEDEVGREMMVECRMPIQSALGN